MAHFDSFRELYLSRQREFFRQPARIFWVYMFPLLMAIVLGLAFRSRPPEAIGVVVVRNAASEAVERALGSAEAKAGRPGRPGIAAKVVGEDEALRDMRNGLTALVVVPETSGRVTYRYDPTRPDANAARAAIDDAIQRAGGRPDPVKTADVAQVEPGTRYIDFLIPGLIGLNVMGGGLWGIGFLLVNFRIAKLLKRFAATPMPRANFLLALLASRMTFLIPDVGVLLALGVWGFGMPIRGSFALVLALVMVGALAFAGIGLLIASRAQTTETVSGLMNLTMLPMWLLSGVFFRYTNFPAPVQWLSRALPLTQLLDALRAVMLQGATLADSVVATALVVLAAWAAGTFWLALRVFRWT